MDLETVVKAAREDEVIRSLLKLDPFEIFFANSAPQHFDKEQFNSFFSLEVAPFIRDAIDPSSDLLLKLPSLGCASCKTGAFGVAALIVAASAAGLGSLSVASTAVVQLAAFAGVGTTTALAFIVSLGATVAGGIANVVNAICDWMGACP
ncbi:hypothetical protein [Paracoccus sp. DMF]|uniref:hypothetical protein n=1 Tax=Paracoccus sp. DMF TaxID=400837 RepID=UPI0021E3B06D|nr:hypothetical protein [Paracoccus sp. DMF]MCV2449673.1 hypothetical protein [Paracoccus sp. DMF]